MRVIIAGSRDIFDMRLLHEAMADSDFHITDVVCGMANGVDTLGRLWAEKNNIKITPFPAPWNDVQGKPDYEIGYRGTSPYWKKAGFFRNGLMAKYANEDPESDGGLIAITNGSPGTADMIRQAKEYGLLIHIHRIPRGN